MAVEWTPALDAKAKAILEKHNTEQYTEALQEISRAARRQVTDNAIRARFTFRGWKTPRSYLKAAPFKLTPLEQKERSDALAKSRAEIKDLLAQLEEARGRQKILDIFPPHGEPKEILPREKSSGKREMTAVALASDWHVEETVTAESVAGRNEYNLDIAEHRMKRFFDAILWNLEHHRADGELLIRDLIFWLGGDLISGFIHDELKETNALTPTETILWLTPKLRDFIWFLLQHSGCERIIVPCSQGNHGRTTVRRQISNGYAQSFEWLMYSWLAEEFRNEKRVEFVVTRSNHQYVTTYGKTLHFHHGDEVNFQSGVGGIGIPLLKAVDAWNSIRYADVHNIGHWHQWRDFDSAVVNGSLIGYNAFALSIKAKFEPPRQAMYFMDKERGKCLATPLWVD